MYKLIWVMKRFDIFFYHSEMFRCFMICLNVLKGSWLTVSPAKMGMCLHCLIITAQALVPNDIIRTNGSVCSVNILDKFIFWAKKLRYIGNLFLIFILNILLFYLKKRFPAQMGSINIWVPGSNLISRSQKRHGHQHNDRLCCRMGTKTSAEVFCTQLRSVGHVLLITEYNNNRLKLLIKRVLSESVPNVK